MQPEWTIPPLPKKETGPDTSHFYAVARCSRCHKNFHHTLRQAETELWLKDRQLNSKLCNSCLEVLWLDSDPDHSPWGKEG